ncbi:uncharacterized protein LOC122957085 [Acropora millepora]|uniref:uncharacterized protein LOC122957085 n=1 Tax=Acropora millepora TaxID=45264 RepID=UPI001CF44F60|nr:uncharacterized protein LOC122957085 [Acropora millepora]
MKIDKGTETGTMATIHAFHRRHHTDVMDPVDTILYGPSTSNQIERWWKELHERLEKFFKSQLTWLNRLSTWLTGNFFLLLWFLWFGESWIYLKTWCGKHRIRAQKDTVLPDGVPNHIYSFPEQYGLEKCGLQVTDDQLQEAAIQSEASSLLMMMTSSLQNSEQSVNESLTQTFETS